MTKDKGFIFDHTLCVNCKACQAACSLENKFTFRARTVYIYNEYLLPEASRYNLSVACNHCEIPVCMDGCLASAYKRDDLTNAVVLDELKCIGCRYCEWNCPYDAPKYDPESGIIGKCHLCYTQIKEGYQPACAEGCPTGALKYGEKEGEEIHQKPEWLDDYKLNPSLHLIGSDKIIPPEIVPATKGIELFVPAQIRNEKRKDWSLVLFSFSATISVSLMIVSYITQKGPGFEYNFLLSLLPGIFSVFHLGKPLRAWRSVFNVFHSPLSREISLYTIYVLINLVLWLTLSPLINLIGAIAGILLLIFIDNVYFYSTRTTSTYLHSGQTFLSGLLITSFLTGELYPFLFIAFIKLVLSLKNLKIRAGKGDDVIRFIRIAFLLISSAGFISGYSYPEPALIVLFLTGEFIDRYIFYEDFEPRSISKSLQIKKHN